jgi:hypothetical protein
MEVRIQILLLFVPEDLETIMAQLVARPTDTELLYFNGVSALTGEYLVAPCTLADLAGFARAAVVEREKDVGPKLGLPLHVDPCDIAQSGWGIVFHADEDPDVRNALACLIEHRRNQVGKEQLVKVLEYKTGMNRAQWLAKYKVAPGSVVPSRVPYYLLLIGSPSLIPFTFSSLLDTEYAVGRLEFSRPEEYARYAQSVIDYETKADQLTSSKTVAFFATRHALDGSTRLSADHLINPLADGYESDGVKYESVPFRCGFRCQKIWGPEATKDALRNVFLPQDGRAPAVLFSATHGVAGWDPGDPEQLESQGALLCQNWPGLGGIDASQYFTGLDLPDNAKIHGMIAFMFACFSIGTPQFNRFLHKRDTPPPEIAKAPFFARLAQKMLSHPGGGALACIGHVDRAWPTSIAPTGVGPQVQPFQNLLESLLNGIPAGQALQDINQTFAVLSASLASLLEDIGYGARVPDEELAQRWLERNDAEGYTVFGDPAVRLRVKELV